MSMTSTGRGPRLFLLLVLICVVAAVAVAGAVYFTRKPAAEHAALTPEQVSAVQGIVRDYLHDHPEFVNDALKKAVEQQRTADEEKRKLNIRALAKDLKQDPDSPVINPDGDVTIIEFFDYACPYCKAMAPKLHDLIDADKKVRFVFKDFPVLGPISEFAARAALASRKQDKYVPFHFALMALRARLNEDLVFSTAKSVGIDVVRLKKDMTAPDVDDVINRNRKLGQGVGVNGTPGFIIGETLIPGAVDVSYIKDLVAKERGS